MFFHFVKYKLDTIKLKTKLFAKHPEKTREKVAETAEIPQTAHQTPPKSRKRAEKSSWTLSLYSAIKQMETIISTFEDK